MSCASTIPSFPRISACAGFLAYTAAGFTGADHGETATVAGHEVYYEVHGDLSSGETPVLLLHGGMMTIETTFAELIPLLSDMRPVIAVEQQGHGHTGDRDGPITLESMRTDTVGVLDHLGVDTAHVVGFSMGGMLGLELAVKNEDRVASLSAISVSQSVEGMLPEIRRMNEDLGFVPSPEVAALMPTEADFAAMRAAFAANNPSGPEAFETVMGKLREFITSDWGWSDAELAGISMPVLIVAGDNDFTPPEHAAGMAETIPNAWLAILPDTTHMNIMTRINVLGPMVENRIEAAEAN